MADKSSNELPKVKEVYKRIFGSDPLLLHPNHQIEFGNQILQNLLVDRSVASSYPVAIDLASDDSRDEFKLPLPQPRKPIPKELKEEYERTKRDRSELREESFKQLKPYTMVARGDTTAERLKDECVDDEAAQLNLANSKSPLEHRLKIATIGYRVSVSALANKGLLNEALCPSPSLWKSFKRKKSGETRDVEKLRRTARRGKSSSGTGWFDAVTRHIETAIARKANFIVLPEFALPPDIGKTSIMARIKKAVKKATHDYFLFSGSRHEGAYNRGFILSQQRGEPVTEEWWHYKMATARSLGENIMGPDTDKMPSYNFSIEHEGEVTSCKVFVAICYDVFDPTTFINYVVQCTNSPKEVYENFILVPSFNPSEEFVHALRDLSFIAQCPVIYVNGLHGDAKVFLYGVAIADIVAAEGDTKAGAQTSPFHEKLEAELSEIEKQTRTLKQEEQEIARALFKMPSDAASKHLDEVWNQLSVKLQQSGARVGFLRELIRDLQQIRASGGLRHLITVQRCADCGSKSHKNDEYCPSDILFYNIDWNLLRALHKFRRYFFKADDFLPLPFQQEVQLKIQARIRQKVREKMARYSRASI